MSSKSESKSEIQVNLKWLKRNEKAFASILFFAFHFTFKLNFRARISSSGSGATSGGAKLNAKPRGEPRKRSSVLPLARLATEATWDWENSEL